MATLAKGDAEIIKYLAQFVNLRPRNLAELTGRSDYVIWRRLRSLVPTRTIRFGDRKGEKLIGRGYVNYVLENADSLRLEEQPDAQFVNAERVYFLTQRGWNKALELGFVKHPVNATDEKSNLNIPHDLKLTDIHMALWRRWGKRLHWFQYRPYTYHRFGEGEDDLIHADAFYWLDLGHVFPARFVEVENRRESEYNSEGDSKLIRKEFAYAAFAKGHFQALHHFSDFDDFSVDIYRLSKPLCRNLAAKSAKRDRALRTRRFMIAPIQEAIAGEERIFITPKDYEQAVYSIADLSAV